MPGKIRKRSQKSIWERRGIAILIAFAIVSFWRGGWGLMDIYLFPNSHELSLWISVAFGIIVLIATESLIERLV